jgi:glycosyltransferase involved in cell wall biosynthesis
MAARNKPSFAFLVLAYNHQKYILEHLESIKYLVQTHAKDIDVDLIVNDDCSKDQTTSLVDAWLGLNENLFRQIKKIYNQKNIGTCASVNNMLDHMVADRCKLTAGDDVYSFENIFELTQYSEDTAMVSGRPLYLIGDNLDLDKVANFLVTATQVIYENKSMLHRFKHLSYSNAPNLLYATECLMDEKVRSYLRKFDVTEDWPLQIAIARQFPIRSFRLIDKVFVYYRRTEGSTYIVANERFTEDKVKLYDDLISVENNWFEMMRLKSRKFCFLLNRATLSKVINIDIYLFLFSFAACLIEICKSHILIKIDVNNHKKHNLLIRSNAKKLNLNLSK